MAGEWYKYLLVAAGAFFLGSINGGVKGVRLACEDPTICKAFTPTSGASFGMERYDFNIPRIDERKGGYIGERPS